MICQSRPIQTKAESALGNRLTPTLNVYHSDTLVEQCHYDARYRTHIMRYSPYAKTQGSAWSY
ncbi:MULTISPECIES: hypothetical protein [Pseudomonas]|uniref:hypothetical protein n=1 Tax=Pseudomonas TaxID=286 RepID=UPI001113D1BB|nr:MULTISPECIES: hypothetical protein [Pseudomonas]